jgi:hypothetical protein
LKYQVRDEIQLGEEAKPDLLRPEVEDGRHCGETNVGCDNSFPFVGLEKR